MTLRAHARSAPKTPPPDGRSQGRRLMCPTRLRGTPANRVSRALLAEALEDGADRHELVGETAPLKLVITIVLANKSSAS
jgi:hypothetical protein